jgi:SAM-dependent methyltransferase
VNTVSSHYVNHLGPLYSWMLGDFEALLQRNLAELAQLGLPMPASAGAVAIDLGAGPGAHAIALARSGYDVIAIDDCAMLLDELATNATQLHVRTVHGDLLQFRAHHTERADLILCMGDTLPHLSTLQEVDRLLIEVAQALAAAGTFVTTFRDYHGAELQGTQRFIPVRSCQHRILTCFLEYAEDHVVVHDILHESDNGAWRTRVSSYPKLRLDPERVVQMLESEGLRVDRDKAPNGMVRIVARREGAPN